jgi:hypothetical protein
MMLVPYLGQSQWTGKVVQTALLRAQECIKILSATDAFEQSPIQVFTRQNVF